MVILSKDIETKEIEIEGFRKILKNPRHPDYKELRIYIKKGWIPVDPADDKIQLEKAKKRKKIAKENKERRPSYCEMEETINKLNDKKMLDTFKEKSSIKYNYNNVLKWYHEEMKKVQNGNDTEKPKTLANNEKGAKGEGNK